MKFIELTGSQLRSVINEGEISERDLLGQGVHLDSIVRVNQQGDIEVRRSDRWDVIGGLLGDFQQRLEGITGLKYV